MAYYNSMAELYKAIDEEMQSTLKDVLDNYVIPKMIEVIKTEVYDKYDPYRYRRRWDELGLYDDRNIKYKISGSATTGYSIHVRNYAQIYSSTHGRYERYDYSWGTSWYRHNSNSYVRDKNYDRVQTGDGKDARYHLDRLIVDGAGRNQLPRDFYQATLEILEREFPKVLAKGLKSRGLDVDLNVNIESSVYDKNFLEAKSEHWN